MNCATGGAVNNFRSSHAPQSPPVPVHVTLAQHHFDSTPRPSSPSSVKRQTTVSASPHPSSKQKLSFVATTPSASLHGHITPQRGASSSATRQFQPSPVHMATSVVGSRSSELSNVRLHQLQCAFNGKNPTYWDQFQTAVDTAETNLEDFRDVPKAELVDVLKDCGFPPLHRSSLATALLQYFTPPSTTITPQRSVEEALSQLTLTQTVEPIGLISPKMVQHAISAEEALQLLEFAFRPNCDFYSAVTRTLGFELDHRQDFRSPIPSSKFPTCGTEGIKTALEHVRDSTRRQLDSEGRDQVTALLALGTGNGKSHILESAGDLLDYPSCLITYNVVMSAALPENDLGSTTTRAQVLALFRFIASVFNANVEKGMKFAVKMYHALSGWLPSGKEDILESTHWLVEHAANIIKTQKGDKVFIGVDEILNTGNNNAAAIVSVYNALARALHRQQVTCLVLVSALSATPLTSWSGNSMANLKIPVLQASEKVRSVGTALWNRNDTAAFDRWCRMVQFAAGNHMRSIVIAWQELVRSKFSGFFPDTICSEISEQLDIKGKCDSFHAPIKQYVTTLLCEDEAAAYSEAPEEVKALISSSSGMPPAFVAHAFPSFKIFCMSNMTAAEKELENAAREFDRLKAFVGAPVVPKSLIDKDKVLLPIPNLGHRFTLRKQYVGRLSFVTTDFQLLEDSMFLPASKTEETRLSPEFENLIAAMKGGCYLHPKNPCHPYIDRAFIATYDDSGELVYVLVIVQDKSNDDMPGCLKGLASAVELLSKSLPSQMKLLCVAHTADAGDTTSQKNWAEKHAPLIVIRRSEIEDFYSRTFGPAIQVCVERHRDGA